TDRCCPEHQRWPQSFFCMIYPATDSPHYPMAEAERHKETDTDEDYAEQVLGFPIQRGGLVIKKLQKGVSILTIEEVCRRFMWREPTGHYDAALHGTETSTKIRFQPPTDWMKIRVF